MNRPEAELIDPELAPEVGYEDEVPEDDTIIGQAFRWSLLVIAAVAALAAITWFALTREPEPVMVEEATPPPPQRSTDAVTVAPPAVEFVDVTRQAGIEFRHVNGATGDRLLPETMGSGAAFFDYDDDGFPDLLLVNSTHWPGAAAGGPPPTSALYHNRGDGTFEEVTAAAGLAELSIYGMGAAVGDIDGDGHRDLFLSAVGPNHLLRNTGDGRFEDITELAGVAGDANQWSSSAGFLDYDRDGDLDLFVTNYVEWSPEIDFSVDYRMTGIGRAYGPPTNYAGTHSYLYRNRGDGTFDDVSAQAGIQVTNPATGLPAGKGLAVLPFDIDNDGWIDLMVANDTVQNFLFRNSGDGTFEEVGMAAGLAFDNTGSATGAMGMDVAAHGEGELAIAVGNFANEMTSFYVGQAGQLLFNDQAIVSGIGPDSRQALSFGVFFFDYDLDGRTDFLQTNGHVENEINVVQPSQHYEQPTQLFWNCGADCARPYIPVPLEATGDLSKPVVGRGAAYADYDRDGDLDVIITQTGRRPLLLRNDQSLGHHWLRVRLAGEGLNRDGIGARIELEANGERQWRTVMPTRSYLSQVELPVTFGLGEAERVERVTVTWPDGVQASVEDVAVDQELVIRREP